MANSERESDASSSGEGLRRGIKTGEDPLRYEYGRENKSPALPPVTGQLAYVEEEKRSDYFHWETYQSHREGAAPSLAEAQEAALEALRRERRF